jgi:predicted nucleotidyltransferase
MANLSHSISLFGATKYSDEFDKKASAIKLESMSLDAVSLRESLTNVCQQFRVERLYLFGSAADGRFNSERSDLDFLVTLEDQPPGEYADNYLGLAQALEKLFGRPADLVTERAIRNPYFRETVFAARQLLYDRRDEKAIA